MLSINIDPVLFKIGFLEIRYYGLVYVLGILLTYYYLKRKKVLDENELDRFMLYLSAGMFLGARLLGIISQDFFILFKDPLEFFMIWHGGMSFFGGFLGGLIGSYLVLRKRIFHVGDYVVLPVSFTLIFGRLANFINQELVGTLTDVSWCFNFSGAAGCRHPYQLYSAFGQLVLFLFLFWLSKKNYRRGELFFSFVLGYGAMRFATDFFRENPRVFGLTGWQWFSVLFFTVGIFYLRKMKKVKDIID
ncbi:prolipoprotein diacylglyceryl transferase [Candidatus Woesearchaeota archaeon]|nr:prolipoprotein diacylglyceryl transferase [Candidatus Woesearchaeota archaeon]